jgi:ribosomal protein L37AE/L43A
MSEKNCDCGGELEFEDVDRFETESIWKCQDCGRFWKHIHEEPFLGQESVWKEVSF